ncbi:response regulator transcription factor [Bacillus weihaiensis]|uniref:DNA-binding response regulator n=1 Tax=Bacillus weihaiensis TaxID=1547283 RepID=A0A1L3MUK4_9BACI|nr:response regulator [Bacillus weihaiensis]APH06026.1 hypothetical protein A9C19_15475 [Bacillus weihaiensis]
MYKIVIVDDEKNIRLGIQAMINREFADKIKTFVAMNGEEALQVLNENDIDIVITDIKMPGMSGIELIHHIQDKGYNPALIILSGYDDFQYAKEAIKCKVKDYLLKPINRAELFQTINKILNEFVSTSLKEDQQKSEFRSSQLNNILLNPNIGEDEIQRISEKLHLSQFSEGYYIGLIKSNEALTANEYIDSIKPLIERHFSKEMSSFIYFCDKDDNIVFILSQIEVFHYLKKVISEEKYIKCRLSISEKHMKLKKLKEAYNQATYTWKYHFLYPRSILISYEEIKEKTMSVELPLDLIHKVSNMIGTEREKELRLHLLSIFDYERISSQPIMYIEDLSKRFNTDVFDYFFNKLGKESIQIFKYYNKVGYIYHYEHFYDYFYAVEDLVTRLHEYVKQVKTVYSEQKYMEKAIAYIHENFHKDLNLAVVSNYISLNYSYFSHTFKEYTGHNFVDYLKKIRIKESKKLLKESDHKVLEISEMVGYKNPKQFARVFRELEGISPKEFRES